MNNFELQAAVIERFDKKINSLVSKSFKDELVIALGESFREVLERDLQHTNVRVFIDNPLKDFLR